MTSARLGIHTRRPLPTCLAGEERPGCERPRGERRSLMREAAQSSRATLSRSSLTGAPSLTKPAAASTSEEAKRSSSRRPTITCWKSGTGRFSSTIVVVSPRTVSSHSPNSSAFETVAESETSATDSGRWMMTSSHTAPRERSAR